MEEGTEIAVALSVEAVEPAPQPTQVLIPGNAEIPTLEFSLSRKNHSQTGVRVVISTEQRKKQMRELLKNECPSLQSRRKCCGHFWKNTISLVLRETDLRKLTLEMLHLRGSLLVESPLQLARK